MNIKGFQKLTLLDYKGYLASTIFLGGCNFKCPFCHNKDLVLSPNSLQNLSKEDILDTLKKRAGIIEAICITGGEPTLYPDLISFIYEIKSLGYLVKLDTNGSNPNMLRQLLQENIIDYIAMDIKNSPQKYVKTTAYPNLIFHKIKESVELIMKNKCSNEFRTTIVSELHTIDDIEQIGHWINGCSAYYLQCYRPSNQVINPIYTSPTKETLIHYKNILEQYIENVQIIGI